MSTPPRQVASTLRSAALVCLAAVALTLAASAGSAQGDRTAVVRVLRESRDFRARVRAALALGSTNDRSATPHLVHALADESPAVRAAAATALGRIADPSALASLRSASSDTSRVVRVEVERAIRQIEANGPAPRSAPSAPPTALTRTLSGDVLPAISVVPQAREIHWPTVRYVVVLGSLENRSSFAHAGLSQVLEREVTRGLVVLRGVAVLREGHEPPDAAREIVRRRLPKLRLEGSVSRVDRQAQAQQLSVRCEVSLLLMDDGRNLRGMLNGAATGSDQRRGHRDQQERQLAEQALAGAIRSAMSGAATAIANAGR